MTWWLSALVLFGLLTVLFLTGLAAAFAFFGINIVGAWIYLGREAGLIQLIRNGIVSITSFSLTPIPFFILMGEVLFHTGVAMKAIDAIDRLIWRVPGRLSVVAVVAGTIFSAISGSTIATTALLGSLLLPQMLKRGYHPNMAMGPIMAIGGVDMLIPPSALTVLLGSLAGISVSQLLIAGIIPGVVLSVMFVAWIVLRAVTNPELGLQRLAGADRDDGDSAHSRLLHRPGEHDAHLPAVLHAARGGVRFRSDMVRRTLSHLHATRAPHPAVRHAALHDEERGAEGN